MAYNPEQNGLTERMNWAIVERSSALLFDANLGKRFWAEAVGTAVYITNRSPTKGLRITPEEAFSGKRPDLSHLRVFGSEAMSFVPKVKRRKWDPKSEACIFIGYGNNGNGYRLYNTKTGKIFVSRDVIFISETVERQDNPKVNEASSTIEIVTEEATNTDESISKPDVEIDSEDSESEVDDNESVTDEFNTTVVERRVDPAETEASTSIALPPQFEDPQSNVVRRSERERRPPGKYTDVQYLP